MRKFLIISILSLFLLPYGTFAASIYIDPSEDAYSTEDTFTAKIRIDPEGECINAAKVVIEFPKELVRAIDVSTGESIFTLWVEGPQIDEGQGVISFAGGVPGGYCGRVPGDPGLTNVLATLILQTPGSGGSDDQIARLDFLEGTEVYLNDGFGTKAELSTYAAEFEIGESIEARGEWFEFLMSDATATQPFSVQLIRDDSMFGGKYFIIFSTTDKESGLSHYEVLERPLDDTFFGKLRIIRRRDDVWRTVRSPYVLQDQQLNSAIMVKAVDKAGNEYIETFVPEEGLRQEAGGFYSLWIFGIALAGLAVLFYIFFQRQTGLKLRRK